MPTASETCPDDVYSLERQLWQRALGQSLIQGMWLLVLYMFLEAGPEGSGGTGAAPDTALLQCLCAVQELLLSSGTG